MSRYACSDSRWSQLSCDWPSVGLFISDLSFGIPGFHRYGSCRIFDNFHTFVDDWRLEAIWRDPFLKCDRALNNICTAPDFSVFWGDPLPYVTWQVWRSRVVSYSWSRVGAKVIPVVQFGDERSFSLCIKGIVKHSVLAVRGPSRNEDMVKWRCGCQYWADNVQPELVIQFGRQEGSDVWSNVLYRPLHSLSKGSCSK